jgi:uncharacterized membrane protein (GlpM family)
MAEILVRILVGGFFVSLFALIGDVLKPKSFAGLFGAAPSIALATIVLTAAKEGRAYVAVEAHSMLFGGIAFFIYAMASVRFLFKGKWPSLLVSASALSIWCAASFTLWLLFLR